MKVPSSPRVGSQPYRAPDVQSPGVTPMQDASGLQAARKGQALEGAGQSVMRVTEILQERRDEAAAREQDQIDDSRAREAEAALADGYHELLNSPTGYRSKVGRAALDSREEVLRSLQETQQRIEEGLTPGQRDRFRASATAYRQQAMRTVDGHHAEQVRAYDIGETEALAAARLRDAAEAYFTPGGREPDGRAGPAIGPPTAFVTFGRNMLTEVERLADLKGLGPAQKAAMLDAAQDALHGEIVQGLVSRGRPDEASRYLGWAKVGADKRADLQKLVAAGAVKQQGRALTENLIASGGGLGDHLKALDAMDDLPVEVYDEAVQRLQARHTAMRTEAAAQRVSAWEAVENHAKLTGGVLDAEHQDLLRRTGQEARYAAWKAQGGHRITTDVGHAVMTTKRAGDLRREFSSLAELHNRYIDHLSRGDLETLSKRWESGDSDLPKEDRKIILADGLRDALGMSRQDELVDKDLFARWENEVMKELRALKTSPRGGAVDDDSLLPEAMRKAVERGRVFLGDRATLSIAVPDSQVGSVAVTLPDGRKVEPRLDRVHPGTGLTLGAMVDATVQAQARRSEPNKPKGYVWSGGEAIPLERFGLRERAAEVVRMAEDLDRRKRSGGLDAVRDAYETTLLEVMRETSAPEQLPTIRARAALRVLSRTSEWAHYGLTRAEIIAAFGDDLTEEQLEEARRQAEGLDFLGRPDRPEGPMQELRGGRFGVGRR